MALWNIAIDGPAGAGKSTIAKAVAKRLGILYLDTGAMYRALALAAIKRGIDPNDATCVKAMLPEIEIGVQNIDGVQHTLLNGEDVTGCIRTPEVTKGASDIGVIPEVRRKMVESQQAIAEKTDIVMDGRDICMYVLPKSKNKFYLTASVEERAKRRLAEMRDKGEYLDVSFEQMREEIARRDHTDSTRECSPLRQAPDAILIDTTEMDAETAVEALISRLKK